MPIATTPARDTPRCDNPSGGARAVVAYPPCRQSRRDRLSLTLVHAMRVIRAPASMFDSALRPAQPRASGRHMTSCAARREWSRRFQTGRIIAASDSPARSLGWIRREPDCAYLTHVSGRNRRIGKRIAGGLPSIMGSIAALNHGKSSIGSTPSAVAIAARSSTSIRR